MAAEYYSMGTFVTLAETVELDFREKTFQIRATHVTLWETYKKDGLPGVSRRVVASAAFENVMCLVVVANAIITAVEQSYRLADKDTTSFAIIDLCFLLVYSLELCLHFHANRCRALHSHWVKFDLALVVTGALSSSMDFIEDGGTSGPMMNVMALRMVRLLRLVRVARTLRLLVYCQELWLLARGLLNSLGTAFHTLVFASVLLFVLGCVAVEALPLTVLRDGTSDEVKVIIESSFADLPTTMLTLVQFITFDSVASIYRPLIGQHPVLTPFFIIVMLLVGIVFMNIVTAIIVNSGLEQSATDRNARKLQLERQRRQLLLDLEQAFYRMDTNSSGSLSKQELSEMDKESMAILEDCLGLDNLVHMFDVLDVEGDGELTISEFCNGITSIALEESQPDVKRMLRLAESLKRSMARCERVQLTIQETVHQVLGTVTQLAQRMDGADSSGSSEDEEEMPRGETPKEEPPRLEPKAGSQPKACSPRARSGSAEKARPPAWEALAAEMQQVRQLLTSERKELKAPPEPWGAFATEMQQLRQLLERPATGQTLEEEEHPTSEHFEHALPCAEEFALPQQPATSLVVPAMLQVDGDSRAATPSRRGSSKHRGRQRRRSR